MREALFLKNNYEKWREAEEALKNPDSVKPDRIADLYLELNDDLAYAQTHYPSSKSTIYLNGITAQIYQQIYKNKKESKNRILEFWTTELPLELYKAKRYFLISFLIFAIAAFVGALSTANDERYIRIILGDYYVNMTLENIEKGDPLAVYSQESEAGMTYRITLHNIRVSFYAFIFGVIFSVGTAYFIFTNGTMVGAFFYFFYQKKLLGTALMGVMIHGTLELSAIVLAGGAGILMGNSILYPGTYSRGLSFVRGAKTGLKLTFGLVPLFMMAGFLESVVTRHNQTIPLAVNILIIFISACIIIGYYILYPVYVHSKVKQQNETYSLIAEANQNLQEG